MLTLDPSKFNVNCHDRKQWFSLRPRDSEMVFILGPTPRKNIVRISIELIQLVRKWQISLKYFFSWSWARKGGWFLNPWVIRRMLVCSVVSGHDIINIEFQCVLTRVLNDIPIAEFCVIAIWDESNGSCRRQCHQSFADRRTSVATAFDKDGSSIFSSSFLSFKTVLKRSRCYVAAPTIRLQMYITSVIRVICSNGQLSTKLWLWPN